MAAHQESADDYTGTVHVFEPSWGPDDRPVQFRVAVCPAGLQWLLQRYRRGRPNPWQSESFCRTRAALIRNLCERGLPYAGELARLPDCLVAPQKACPEAETTEGPMAATLDP